MDQTHGFIGDWLAGLGAGSPSRGEGMEVSLEHSWPWPPWLTLLVLALLALVVFWGYLRQREDVSRRFRLILASLRMTLVLLVIFMMYGWMLNRHRTDLPDLVVVVDRSASMALADEYRNEPLRQMIQAYMRQSGFETYRRWDQALSLLFDSGLGWLNRLQERYRLKVYCVSDVAQRIEAVGDATEDGYSASLSELQPDQPASLLGSSLEQILAAQRGRPTAAVIFLTDGITTSGTSLVDAAELARRKAIPLYIVGLGDDYPPRDLRITDVLVDDVVFVDDVVNFDVTVQQEGFPQKSVAVRLLDATTEEELARQQLQLEPSAINQTARLAYRPSREGAHEFLLEIEEQEGEANRENNRVRRTVQVRDATIRVLFVQEYPSYEFRALKNLLSRMVRRDGGGRLIELKTVLQEADFEYAEQDETALRVFPVDRDEIFAFDVIIFGDVNPTYLSSSVMQHVADFVTDRGGGLVFISGPRFTPLAYRRTPLEDLIPVELATASMPDADRVLRDPYRVEPTPLGSESALMQLGDSFGGSQRIWLQLPGLYWLLAAPELRPAARVLAVSSQQTASGEPLPVVVMQFTGAGKVIFLASDESYRWSQLHGSDIYYVRFWLQMLRYLSRSKLLSDREAAEMITDRQQYLHGDPVRLLVRFLDERRAPIRDDGVRVLIEEERDESRREVTLSRDAVQRGEFAGQISDLLPGSYRLRMVSPMLEPQPPAQRFRVEPPASEQARLEMQAAELDQAAQVSRGKFYPFPEAARLLRELPEGRHVRIESLPAEPIWNSWWSALVFVGVITAEWLLRKRAGMI